MRKSWSVLLFALSFIILTAASMPGDLTWAEATEEAPQAAVDKTAGMGMSTEIQVNIDGELTAFDPPARLMDNRLMTPLRAAAEALGAQVDWSEDADTAAVSKDDTIVELRLGEATATFDGSETELSDPTEMIDGSIYVPLRSFCELLGAVVSWNDESRTVYIASGSTPLPVVGSEEELRALLEQSKQEAATAGATGAGGIVEEAAPIVRPAPSLQKNAASAERGAPPAADGGAATGGAATGGSSAGGSAGGSSAIDYSSTNVQEQGVDEADIVKTDGEYIYTVSQGRVMIVRAYPAENMELAGQIELEQFRPQEMYVDNERLVVIGSTVTPAPMIKQKAAANLPITPMRYPVVVSTSMKAIVYDITDKSNIVKQRELELGGRYVTSRKIGSALYLIANQQSYAYIPMAGGGSKMGDVPEPPTYRDSAGDGAASEPISLGYDRIRYFPDSLYSSYLVIGSIDLAASHPDFDVQAYLGAGQTVYASEKNLYVTTTRSQYSVDSSAADSPTQQTAIYRFALDRGKARYASQGLVPGSAA